MCYMRDVLSYAESDIITCLATSRPTAIYATYQLLLQMIDKHLDLPIPPPDHWQSTTRSDNRQITTDSIQVTARTGNNQVTTDTVQATTRTDNSQATPDSIQVTARTDNRQIKDISCKEQVISRTDNRGETMLTDNQDITKAPCDVQTMPEDDNTHKISSLSSHQVKVAYKHKIGVQLLTKLVV